MSGGRQHQPEAVRLPQNPEAERAVLGAILLDNAQFVPAAAIVKPADFFNRSNNLIFQTIAAMRERGEAADILTVPDALARANGNGIGELETVGGSAYIASLVDGVPRITNIEYYARIVREKSILRQLAHAGHAIEMAAVAGGEEAWAVLGRGRLALSELTDQQGTTDLFDTRQEFEDAADATFSIKNFLQDYAVTAIAALSGHGKTWLSLDIVRALLFGAGLLWGLFEVTERAEKVIYFIPEVSRPAFKPRLQITGLYGELDKRLFVRTLTKGPAVPLTDSRVLREVEGARVFVDTAIRFMQAVDENSASEAAAALSADFFALQRAGAKSIIPLFHSPKAFLNQTSMSLEGMIRGSGEFGAVLATGWGLRQIDLAANIVHVENIKPRDFEPCAPFQLIGRPHISKEGGFHLHRRNCGPLADYLDVGKKKGGGAPAQDRAAKAANLALMRQWLTQDPNLTNQALQGKFHTAGIDVAEGTVRSYRSEIKGRAT
jgi:hypothetical protein